MGWELIDVDVGISVANLLGLLLLMRPVDCVFCLGTWYTGPIGVRLQWHWWLQSPWDCSTAALDRSANVVEVFTAVLSMESSLLLCMYYTGVPGIPV